MKGFLRWGFMLHEIFSSAMLDWQEALLLGVGDQPVLHGRPVCVEFTITIGLLYSGSTEGPPRQKVVARATHNFCRVFKESETMARAVLENKNETSTKSVLTRKEPF